MGPIRLSKCAALAGAGALLTETHHRRVSNAVTSRVSLWRRSASCPLVPGRQQVIAQPSVPPPCDNGAETVIRTWRQGTLRRQSRIPVEFLAEIRFGKCECILKAQTRVLFYKVSPAATKSSAESGGAHALHRL